MAWPPKLDDKSGVMRKRCQIRKALGSGARVAIQCGSFLVFLHSLPSVNAGDTVYSKRSDNGTERRNAPAFSDEVLRFQGKPLDVWQARAHLL